MEGPSKICLLGYSEAAEDSLEAVGGGRRGTGCRELYLCNTGSSKRGKVGVSCVGKSLQGELDEMTPPVPVLSPPDESLRLAMWSLILRSGGSHVRKTRLFLGDPGKGPTPERKCLEGFQQEPYGPNPSKSRTGRVRSGLHPGMVHARNPPQNKKPVAAGGDVTNQLAKGMYYETEEL